MHTAILLNIGNSHTNIVRWAHQRAAERERHATPELLAPGWGSPLLAAHPELPRVAACVVPAVRQALGERFPEASFTWLDALQPVGLDFSPVDPRTVGADRVANAVAAAELLPLPAIVIDCGTAITFEVVDEARRFRGGAILPGRRLSRRALATGTGQLPDVPLGSELPAAIGTDTAHAILAGVDLGIVGAVDRLIAATAEELGGGLPACLVGGDAPYFIRHLAHAEAGPPDFTLSGIAIAGRRLLASSTGGTP